MRADNIPITLRLVLYLSGLLLGVAVGGTIVIAALAVVFTPAGDLLDSLLTANINPKFPWYLTRATGTVAYLLLTGSTAWGLILSTKIVKEVTPAPVSLAMHNALSWVAIGLAGLHAWLLLLDTYYVYLPSHLFIPFTGPYRPAWVGLGTLSLYLMVLLSVSFGWRKLIGQKGWHRLHILSFPTFMMVTLHGLLAGTDGSKWEMQALMTASGLLILFLTNYRLLATVKKRRQTS